MALGTLKETKIRLATILFLLTRAMSIGDYMEGDIPSFPSVLVLNSNIAVVIEILPYHL
jgi:hypothetical protein